MDEQNVSVCSLQVWSLILNWRGALHKDSTSLLHELGISKDMDEVISCRILSYTANMFRPYQNSTEQGLAAHWRTNARAPHL